MRNKFKKFCVKFVELKKLKWHEDVDPNHLQELKKQILLDKVLKFAIVVDKNTNIILDGAHRARALQELRCEKIPVVFVDYNSPEIEVYSWRNHDPPTKDDVIKAGLSRRKLPPKTSKHMIRIGSVLKHISSIERRVDIPLELLR